MIVFDRKLDEPSAAMALVPKDQKAELAPVEKFVWKDPADVIRGEEVLTMEGWQQARESGWQLYREFDEPYGLTVKGSDTRRVDLPRFYWPDGRPAVQVRNPRDDFYSLGSPEELHGFTKLLLSELQPAIDQFGAITVRDDDGQWKLLHELMLPTTRRGKIKVRRARGISHSAGGHEIYKFWICEHGADDYGVDMRWTLSERYLALLSEEKLQPRKGF